MLRSSEVPQSERRQSDRLSILDDPIYVSPRIELSDDSKRHSVVSNTSSRASLRRQSLVALQYMAEKDPKTLAEKLQALYADTNLHPPEETDESEAEREASDKGEDVERVRDEDSRRLTAASAQIGGDAEALGRLSFMTDRSAQTDLSGTASDTASAFNPDDRMSRPRGYSSPPRPSSRRSSTEQHRNFQRAAKLTKVLGSEVLTRGMSTLERVLIPLLPAKCESMVVIEDIEYDMLEDPEAGEEDRRALSRLQETII